MSPFVTILKKIKPSTIRGQLIWGVAVVHLLLMTVFVFDMVSRQKRFLKKQNREQATNFVNDFAVNSIPYIIANDPDQLQRFILFHTNFPNLRYAMVLSADEIVMAHTNTSLIGKKPTDSISRQLNRLSTGKILIEDDHVLDLAVPIFADKKIIGWARAGLGQDYIESNLTTIVRDGLVYILVALFAGVVFALLIGNQLTAELYKLITTTARIKEGDRAIRAAPYKTVELQHLGTAFNQMLDEISSNEKLFGMMVENMPVGVWILDEKGKIISGNSAGKEIWGGSHYVDINEFGVYKGWRTSTKELIEPEQWAAALAIKKGQKTLNEEIEIETFDGRRKFILNSAMPLMGKEGKVIGAIAINVDITERKKTIEQLALSESTFRSAFNHSAIGMGLVAPDGKFLRVNKELCTMLGYSEKEMLAMTFHQITHPDDSRENLDYLKQIFSGEINNFRMYKRYFHKNGTIVWAHLTSTLVRDAQNQPLFFVSQIEDVTERKKTLEQLALSESTFRSAFNYSAIGMALVSPEGKILEGNKQLYKMLGYTENDILPLSFQDITHPDDREQGLRYQKQAIEGQSDFFQMDKRYVHKNGSIISAHVSISMVRDNQNKPLFAVAQIEDVTERKKTNEQLALSESTFRSAFNYSTIGMSITSPDGKFLRVNEGLCRMLGYSMEEVLASNFTNLTHPDDLKENLVYLGHLLEGKTTHFQMEKRYFHKNGTIVWGHLSVSLVRDSEKKPMFFVAQIEDITERKRTLERLALSESTFRSAFDYSAIGLALVAPDGSFLRVNKALCMVVGYREKELLALTFQDITHPDDLDEDIKNVKKTLSGKIDSYRMEKRYFHKDGHIVWANLGVSLVRDGQNQPLFFVSQVEDITERKKSEQLIKESEEKFRQLVEETLVGVFILQDGRFVYVNPQFEKISGYTKKDLLNTMSYEQLIHKDDLEKVEKNYSSGNSADKHSDHYTFRAIRKDGAILYIEIIISPISFEGQPADIGTIIDLTEKIEEEKRINKAVTDAQEKERQEISMELHDNVKQMMAATLLNIDFMKMIVRDDQNAGPVINNIKNYIRDAIEELRRISHQLAPSIDESISLQEKIKTMVNTMNVSESIGINYHFDKLQEEVKADVQLTVYRIVQEQVSNILKHAKASLIDITLKRHNGDICLLIKDNGVGFDTSQIKNGIGLENIKRRVQILNGNFSIQAFPGNGCTLYVEVPVN